MSIEKNSIQRVFPSEPTLRRLPWYLAYVSLLRSRNIEYVSSTAIAKDINVDASQIAKDLSVLGIKGKTRIDYEENVGLNIVAGFDINPSVVGTTIKNVPIFHIDELARRIAAYRAGIAIVAVPVDVAQQTADMAVSAGVRALWNFTPFRILARPGIVIQNTSIYAHLAVMYNRLSSQSESR